jgi:hypothetical protein
MRIKGLIAAMALFAGLAGCSWVSYEPYPGVGQPHVGVPLTRCGTCEADAAVLQPAPYNHMLK